MSATEDKINQRYVGLAFLLLAAAVLACNRTVPTATPPIGTAAPVVATDTLTPMPGATAAATTIPALTATATPPPTASSPIPDSPTPTTGTPQGAAGYISEGAAVIPEKPVGRTGDKVEIQVSIVIIIRPRNPLPIACIIKRARRHVGEGSATMGSHTTVGIHDNFPPGQTGIAVGTADHKVTGRINQEVKSIGEQDFNAVRNGFLNPWYQDLNQVFPYF